MTNREAAMCAVVLLLAACAKNGPEEAGAGASVSEGGIEYRAETRVAESFPVQLHTTVTMTNASAAGMDVELPGGCPVLLRARRAEDTVRVAFDQAQVRVCTMQLLQFRLAAGESRTFEGSADAGEILGDSLPDGRYLLSAVLRPNGRLVEVPAGEVSLAVPR